jgi:glycerol-3-phosphate dehydrogenase
LFSSTRNEGDLALIGTTDIPLEGRAEDARIDQSEIGYLLSVVNRYFENALKFDEVISSFLAYPPL